MYKKMYHLIFNAVNDALRLLEEGNVWDAKKTLMDAQCEAEEIYISTEDNEEDNVRLLFPPEIDIP